MSKYGERHKTRSAPCATKGANGQQCDKPGVRLANTRAGLNWHCEEHYAQIKAS